MQTTEQQAPSNPAAEAWQAYHLTECPPHIVRHVPDLTKDEPPPEGYLWSNMDRDPPKIGERVTSKMHRNLGGVVTGYFVERRWVGLHVKLDTPFIRSDGKKFDDVFVFGIDLPTSDPSPQAPSPTPPAPSDDYRIRLPRAWPLRCYGKVIDQTNRLREVFHLAQNYYHEDRRVYDGKAISPERAGELFALAHALLVNVAQGAAGVYSQAGLEVPPEIDWAARGALPPSDFRPSALPSPSLKPQAEVVASNANYALTEDRADSDPPLRSLPNSAFRPSGGSDLPTSAHPTSALSPQSATPTAGLSPAANDPAARSLPGAAA